MFRSVLQWIGCAVLVVAGFALLLWLPDPQQHHDAEQARAVQPQPPAHDVEGPAPSARPVGLHGASARP
jgi:hypothetical protein